MKLDELAKSLLSTYKFVHRYGVKYAQVWGNVNKKSVTKYAAGIVFASFTAKYTQNDSVHIFVFLTQLF